MTEKFEIPVSDTRRLHVIYDPSDPTTCPPSDLPGTQPVDFVAAFAEPLPALVISDMVGAPSTDAHLLRRWMDISLSVTAYSH